MKAKRNRTLRFFERLGSIGRGFGNMWRDFKKLRRWREIVLASSLVLIFIVLFFVLRGASQPNGLQVYVDGEHIGVMRWDRGDLDPEYLTVHIVQRLRTQMGTDIFPVSEIVATPIRVGRNDDAVNFDTMVNDISRIFMYQLNGGLIIVGGERIAFLPNHEQAVAMIAYIVERFVNENTTSSYLVDDVVVTSTLLDGTDIMTWQIALARLTTPRVVEQVHIVQHLENLYNIAIMHGMTLNALLAANPTIDPAAFIQPGTPLVVLPNIPIISVRTYETSTFEEYITIDGERVLARITADITRINGTEVARRVLATETIR